MMAQEVWTPPRAASKIIKIIETVFSIHGMDRFPLDVPTVAMEANKIFGWDDPITKVQAVNIDRFEGALFPNENFSEWLLLYNDAISVPGRIRFTQAHELGHYVLHRSRKRPFQCGDADILTKPGDESNIESQADVFASYLLMPIDDFRKQINSVVDLDLLGNCANRYGVSLIAVILKWLQFTEQSAVLIISKSGFIDWAWSSESAYKAGAFIRSKQSVVEIPAGTLAIDDSVRVERAGREVSAAAWFKYADKGVSVREMKVQADQFDCTITLLILPKLANFWPPHVYPSND